LKCLIDLSFHDTVEENMQCNTLFFIRTNLQKHEAHKFKNKLRTIPASAEEKSPKFSI